MCNEAERSRRGGEPGGGGGSPAQVALAAFQQGIASREHIYIYIYILYLQRGATRQRGNRTKPSGHSAQRG